MYELRENSICFLVEVSRATEPFLSTIKEFLIDLLNEKSDNDDRSFSFNVGRFDREFSFWQEQAIWCDRKSAIDASNWIRSWPLVADRPAIDLVTGGVTIAPHTTTALVRAFSDPFVKSINLISASVPFESTNDLLSHVRLASKDRPVHVTFLTDHERINHKAMEILNLISKETNGEFRLAYNDNQRLRTSPPKPSSRSRIEIDNIDERIRIRSSTLLSSSGRSSLDFYDSNQSQQSHSFSDLKINCATNAEHSPLHHSDRSITLMTSPISSPDRLITFGVENAVIDHRPRTGHLRHEILIEDPKSDEYQRQVQDRFADFYANKNQHHHHDHHDHHRPHKSDPNYQSIKRLLIRYQERKQQQSHPTSSSSSSSSSPSPPSSLTTANHEKYSHEKLLNSARMRNSHQVSTARSHSARVPRTSRRSSSSSSSSSSTSSSSNSNISRKSPNSSNDVIGDRSSHHLIMNGKSIKKPTTPLITPTTQKSFIDNVSSVRRYTVGSVPPSTRSTVTTAKPIWRPATARREFITSGLRPGILKQQGEDRSSAWMNQWMNEWVKRHEPKHAHHGHNAIGTQASSAILNRSKSDSNTLRLNTYTQTSTAQHKTDQNPEVFTIRELLHQNNKLIDALHHSNHSNGTSRSTTDSKRKVTSRYHPTVENHFHHHKHDAEEERIRTNREKIFSKIRAAQNEQEWDQITKAAEAKKKINDEIKRLAHIVRQPNVAELHMQTTNNNTSRWDHMRKSRQQMLDDISKRKDAIQKQQQQAHYGVIWKKLVNHPTDHHTIDHHPMATSRKSQEMIAHLP